MVTSLVFRISVIFLLICYQWNIYCLRLSTIWLRGTSNTQFKMELNAYEKDEVISNNNVISERDMYIRRITKTLPFIAALVVQPTLASALISLNTQSNKNENHLRIPLMKYDGVYLMNYTVNGNNYRGIVDTGSPFLIVPSVNTRIWGFTDKDSKFYADSGLSKTTEIFGGQDYESYWRVGDMQLSGSYLLKSVVFAHVGEDIMRPPGGVFVGLIKYKALDIRPTLLSQMKYSAIRFDSLSKELLLSKLPLIVTPKDKASAIKMVDLRVLGDPVYHYAALVKSLEVNGHRVGGKSTIYAVFDTGTTGCVLSDDLMNDYETPNPIRSIRIVLLTESGGEVVVESKATREEIFVVTAAKIPWFVKGDEEALKNYYADTTVEIQTTKAASLDRRDSIDTAVEGEEEQDEEDMISANISRRLISEPQVVVVGLTFYKNKVLTIDIDEGRLSLTPSEIKSTNKEIA